MMNASSMKKGQLVAKARLLHTIAL